MATAVLSPLGTMKTSQDHGEEEAHAIESPLFEYNDEPMQDDEVSIPSLSDDVDMDTDTVERPTFGGLINLGNTCYLNSALQMLASLESFSLQTPPKVESTLRNEFLQVLERLGNGETTSPAALKRAVDTLSPLFVGYRQQDSHEFLTTLLDLLDEAYKKTDEPIDSAEVEEHKDPSDEVREGPADDLVAEPFLETDSAMSMGGASSEMNPALDVLRSRSLMDLQVEDISHLLHGQGPAKALEVTREEAAKVPQCKLIGGRAIAPMSAVIHLSSVNAKQDDLPAAMLPPAEAQAQEERGPTPIEKYFAMEVRARLTCDSCKYTRSHLEKYHHLSLDVSSGSVDEGLRKFFAPECRQIKCEKCFCETATQYMEIIKLPRALLLHCKRFIVDVSPDYSSVTYRKNQSPFEFEGNIILSEFLGEGSPQGRFRIRSVVNHIGSSASCGHYTADAVCTYPNGERGWMRFNDSMVTQVSVEDAMGEAAQRTAYMVMYELE